MRRPTGLTALVALLSLSSPICAQTWNNQDLTGGTETLTFVAVPTMSAAAGEDAVIGLSSGPATGYASLAASVRFGPKGIDARNGGVYAAVTPAPYTAGSSYTFQMSINIAAHTYSVVVHSPNGAQAVIATNYKFRTEQANVRSLANLATYSLKGGVTVTNGVITSPLTIRGH